MLLIRNHTRTSDRLIRKVVKFARKFFDKEIFKKLEVHFWEDCSDYVSGTAWAVKPDKDFKPASKKSEYFVFIWIGRNIKYPFRWQYRKRAGSKFVKNKSEALIQTIGHRFLSYK